VGGGSLGAGVGSVVGGSGVTGGFAGGCAPVVGDPFPPPPPPPQPAASNVAHKIAIAPSDVVRSIFTAALSVR
jgi:hypothetical protein